MAPYLRSRSLPLARIAFKKSARYHVYAPSSAPGAYAGAVVFAHGSGQPAPATGEAIAHGTGLQAPRMLPVSQIAPVV